MSGIGEGFGNTCLYLMNTDNQASSPITLFEATKIPRAIL